MRGHLPWVPVYERKSPPIVTFPFCVPTVPLRSRFVPQFDPLCPDLHTGCNPPLSVKTCYPVGLVIWTPVYLLICFRMLANSFCCGFYSSFACRTSSSVFQLNVQIVNNTAVTLFRSLHVCLEEQHSPKDFTRASSPFTLDMTVDVIKGK